MIYDDNDFIFPKIDMNLQIFLIWNFYSLDWLISRSKTANLFAVYLILSNQFSSVFCSIHCIQFCPMFILMKISILFVSFLICCLEITDRFIVWKDTSDFRNDDDNFMTTHKNFTRLYFLWSKRVFWRPSKVPLVTNAK